MDTQNLTPALVVNDIELTATLPQEMVESQRQLIAWCENKIAAVRLDSKELLEAYNHAKNFSWKFDVLERQYRKSVKTVQYYEKIKSALEAGFYIVPNFPIQMFAIRTTKEDPKAGYVEYFWSDHIQYAQELPQGKGEYKNPFPLIVRDKHKNSEGREEQSSYASDWDELEFPITMAKPRIMEATGRAMALQIFDQIGIMPANKKEDPVIIGQIITHKKTVSFMIAWHLNTNVL